MAVFFMCAPRDSSQFEFFLNRVEEFGFAHIFATGDLEVLGDIVKLGAL